jgi:hypothetical protein
VLSLLAVHLGLISFAQAEPEPKPVLTLIEYGGWSGIGYPLPVGLAFVAYDNGLIIQSLRRIPGDEALFVSSRRTPAEVAVLVAEAKLTLREVRSRDRQPDGLPTDQGWTIILYQDGDKTELVEVATYGLPCMAGDRELKEPFKAELRAATDSRYLQFCDSLAQRAFPDAKPWFPKEMLVFLRAQPDRPDEVIEWPSDWPKTWQESADHTSRAICVPITERPSSMTKEMLYPSGTHAKITAVEETKLAWWVIAGLEVSMPGEISLVRNGNRTRMLHGPCSDIKTPG